MHTTYDWITVAMFAALVVLFLNRSVMDAPPDRVWHYLAPAIGCAAANALGNEGMDALAIAVLVAVAVYVFMVLKPLPKQ
jgi:hypothetical protein